MFCKSYSTQFGYRHSSKSLRLPVLEGLAVVADTLVQGFKNLPGLTLSLMLCHSAAFAGDYAAQIKHLTVAERHNAFWLDAQIDYLLSATAQEALDKGVPLTWVLAIKVEHLTNLWAHTVVEWRRPYSIQFHALLNQYAVKNGQTATTEMFLSLNAALSFMAHVRDVKLLEPKQLVPGERYQVAVQAQFDTEALPSPLRPFAYLNSDWFLSSDWTLCPLPDSNSH